MVNIRRKELNFIGNRNVFFIISGILIIIAILSLSIRGLNFGPEFVGGSTITYLDVKDANEQTVREAIIDAGYTDGTPVVQTITSADVSGFLIQLNTTDVQETEEIASAAAEELGVSSENIQVSTIGPNWGANVIQSSVIALIVSIILIIIYIWIRFHDVKMALTAILALCHDILIVIGIYALFGREITPNAVAALLTIMGYSLYDKIVMFHRINENLHVKNIHFSIWTVVNHSVNQTIVRTMNTTLTSLIPVITMLIFGGTTLQDFAFAMMLGLICGSYSSFAIAVPIYTIWKSKEADIQPLQKKYGNTVCLDARRINENITPTAA